MSAILARINFGGAPIDRDAFCRAFDVMAPYGGDGSNTWIEGPVGLGQHLLRFTPESSYEQQPHQWGNAVIVADARIDNRDELCHRFDLSPTEAAVTPDSHLILRAYRLWGEDCTAHLLGDFAFAIWDQQHRRLFCARDHIGARPLYYHHTPSTVVAATDIRALLAFSDVSDEIDEHEIANFLIWREPTKKRTFFQHVHMIYPGQQIQVRATGVTQKKHWLASDAADVRYKTPSEYTEHFRELLEEAITARIRTNYPIGAHLSGGLDSSGLAMLANRQLRQQGRSLNMTYTWSPATSDAYPPARHDERNTIELICRQEGLEIQYGTATAEGLRATLRRDMAVEASPELFEELPVLANAHGRGIRSILSGWGGDEAATFDGRGYVAYLFKHGHLIKFGQIIRHHAGFRHPWRTIKIMFRYAMLPLLPDALYNRIDPNYRADRQPVYIHPIFAAQYPHVTDFRHAAWREVADPREIQVRLIERGHLAERMGLWAVWSASHRIIYSYPLTDRRILEFALGLPRDLLYHRRTSRYLFREALKDILPPLPTKADPINECKRLACGFACWRILAEEVRTGQLLQDDIPWLDVEKLRTRLLEIPEETTFDQLREFIPLAAAVRVWHLWQRYGERTEVQR